MENATQKRLVKRLREKVSKTKHTFTLDDGLYARFIAACAKRGLKVSPTVDVLIKDFLGE